MQTEVQAPLVSSNAHLTTGTTLDCRGRPPTHIHVSKWDERDHHTFTRVLSQNDGDYSRCVGGACRMMPHLSRKEVIRHARWDAERSDLLLKKKVAIKQWRSRQESVRSGRMNDIAVTESRSSRLDKLQEGVRRANERQFREDQRRQLEEWWREQADEVELRRSKRAQQEAEEKRKREVERAVHRAKKEAVERYKLEKQKEIEERKLKESDEIQDPVSKTLRREEKKRSAERLRVMQQRDLNYVQQRRTAIDASKNAAVERADRQRILARKLGFTAERDSSRLLRRTQSLVQRAKPSNEEEESAKKVFAAVPRIQHKIIPSWRRDL